MTTTFERLRLDVGLVHAVNDAIIAVASHRGPTIVGGLHPDADVDACTLRHRLMAATCPFRAEMDWSVRSIEVGGGLESCGGDLYRSVGRPREERWFATLLCADAVFAVLDDLTREDVADEGVLVTLKPDPGLGVTVVCVTSEGLATDSAVGRVSEAAYAACLTAELLGIQVDPD